MFSSAPYSQTSSAYVPTFHTLIKQQASLLLVRKSILIFKLLCSKLEDKKFCTDRYRAFPDFNLHLIYSWTEFGFVEVFPKHLNCSTLSKNLLSIFILLLLSAFWSQDMNMYLVLSAFTYSSISLLTTTIAHVFSLQFIRFRKILNIISVNQKLFCTV